MFLFSVEGDKGYFGWVLEPTAEKVTAPALTPNTALDMVKLTKTSTDTIFRKATAWSEAMHPLLLRNKKSK